MLRQLDATALFPAYARRDGPHGLRYTAEKMDMVEAGHRESGFRLIDYAVRLLARRQVALSTYRSAPLPDRPALQLHTVRQAKRPSVSASATLEMHSVLVANSQFAGGAGCGRLQDRNAGRKVITRVGGCSLILLCS